MSLNSLKIATSGYLKRTTKAVLVIAVAGYLNFGSIPPPNPNPPNVFNGGGGGGGFTSKRDIYNSKEPKKKQETIKLVLKMDDYEIELIKMKQNNIAVKLTEEPFLTEQSPLKVTVYV